MPIEEAIYAPLLILLCLFGGTVGMKYKPCVVYCLSDSHSSSLIPSFFFSLFSVSILLGLHDDNNVGDGE